MALKNQDDYIFIGIVDDFQNGDNADDAPIGGSTTVTVQPGVVYRISNLQLNLGSSGGGERATAQVRDQNNTIYCELVGNGIGSFKLDSESNGVPIGNRIGPFGTATLVATGLVNKASQNADLFASAYATLEREIPSPSATTIV